MMEWKEVRLGDVCSAQNGFAFKSEQFIKNGNCKIIKIKELKDGSIVFTDDSAEVEDDAKFKKYEVFQNDILFALTGDPVSRPNPFSWVGRVARYNHTKKALINQRVCKMLFTDKIDSNFFYYYFRQQSVLAELAGKARGSASQANISTNEILNTIISLPSLFYQRRIASILSSLDKKIETNNKINANLEEMAQAIFKNWFVDFAPFKDGKFVESELGMIPEGWRVGTLSDITKNLSIKVKEREDVKVLSPVTTGELMLSEEYFTTQVFSASLAKYKVVKQGDFAYNPARVNIGSLGRNEFDFDGCVSPVYIVFSVQHGYENFFDLLRRTENFKSSVQSRAIGGVRQSLNYEDFGMIDCVIPSLNSVEAFNNVYDEIKKMKKHNDEENQRLASIRDALLPRLMSGEIEV